MVDYKLLSYRADGRHRSGFLVNGRIHDLARWTLDEADSTLLGVLEEWSSARGRIEQAALRAFESPASGRLAQHVRLASPVLYPPAIYCAGANYRDHVREMAALRGRAPDPDPKMVGQFPWHFVKPSRVVVGDQEIVWLPAASMAVDWEVELIAVIGRKTRNVAVEAALDYVAGYTVANDLSARDLFRRSATPETSPFYFDWLAHKGFDGACPAGPWITPSNQIADPQNLAIGLKVNGLTKQESNTREMIFGVAEQIAHLSSLRTLYPGDLVLTGTPAGVGAARREFLKPGDLVEAWVESIGSLRTSIGYPSFPDS